MMLQTEHRAPRMLSRAQGETNSATDGPEQRVQDEALTLLQPGLKNLLRSTADGSREC